MSNEAARNRALDVLRPSGLGVTRLFIHALPDYAELAGLVLAGALPQAGTLTARGLTISNSHWLDQRDFARILAVLRTAGS